MLSGIFSRNRPSRSNRTAVPPERSSVVVPRNPRNVPSVITHSYDRALEEPKIVIRAECHIPKPDETKDKENGKPLFYRIHLTHCHRAPGDEENGSTLGVRLGKLKCRNAIIRRIGDADNESKKSALRIALKNH